MTEKFRSCFYTSFGTGVVHASGHGITRVELPDISRKNTAVLRINVQKSISSRVTDNASELLQRYFAGEPVAFGDLPVDLSGIPAFRYKILNAIRSIPYGSVRSYGQIAEACGFPRAARAIGGVMASNPVPVIIPCHRVIGSSGRLTGFSAPGGEISKMMLLKMEGIEFKGLLVMQKQLVMNR